MSRTSSRRGGPREEGGQDGWNTAPAVNRNAGNLTHFGKLSKSTNAPPSSNPFAALTKQGGKGREAVPTLSRAQSSANMGNMFAALGGEAPTELPPLATTSTTSRAPSRKPSLDLGPGGIPESPMTRKKLVLAPRTIPTPDTPVAEAPEAEAEEDETAAAESAGPSMTKDQAESRISEDIKEFWNGRNADDAVLYFSSLPTEHRHLLVSSMVSSALEKKEADVILVADVFSKAAGEYVSEEAFEQGLLPTVEAVDDLSVDIPKAYAFVARLLHGAKLTSAKVEEMGTKIFVDGDPLTPPSERLLKEFEKLST